MRNSFGPVLAALKKQAFKQPAVTEIAERSEDPYKVLISCILSLRTRDTTTERISALLFKKAGTPAKMSSLPVRTIMRIIRPVNYYRTKAKRIRDISRILLKKHKGRVPDNIEELMMLKGVGRKTANIVVVYGFSKPGIPVDTHVHRISNRLGWVRTATPEKTEAELRKLLPKAYWHDLNDLLVQFGQNVCLPRNPRCSECPVSKWCAYYRSVKISQ